MVAEEDVVGVRAIDLSELTQRVAKVELACSTYAHECRAQPVPCAMHRELVQVTQCIYNPWGAGALWVRDGEWVHCA